MRKTKSPLRGSVSQNNTVRVRVRDETGTGFLVRLGLLLGFLLIVTGIAIWGWHAGLPQRAARSLLDDILTLTQKMQFVVKDIAVEGRHQSNKDDVFDALGTERGAPIFALDTHEAAARLGKLPWVGSVAVERHLPDSVSVILTERVPSARWQHDEKVYVIDEEGHVLPAAKPEDFANLPLVVGVGAEQGAQNLIALLKKYPDIAGLTDSAVRVSERRWDLHLKPKVTVRLPEDSGAEGEVNNALHRLSVLIAESNILSRNIVSIDLRMPDRVAYEPAPGAKTAGDKTP